MSPTDPSSHTRMLMMAELDGEITDVERDELANLLDSHPDLRTEYRQLQQLRETTRMTRISTPSDEAWDSYWHSVYRRLERGTAWIFLSVGATVLLGWGVWHGVQALLADTSMPLVIKLAIFSLGFGSILLAISILREKLFARRHDRFLEVRR